MATTSAGHLSSENQFDVPSDVYHFHRVRILLRSFNLDCENFSLFQVSAIVDGIHVDTRTVSVPDDPEKLPVFVNFSVNAVHARWSKEHDFGISENLANRYSNAYELNNAMELLKQNYRFVKVKQVFDNVTNKVSEFMYITNETNNKHKPHFLIVGGLRENLPVAREVIIRFARHLVEGYRRDVSIPSDSGFVTSAARGTFLSKLRSEAK